ncbi:putative ribonuclease H-like domain-containing protein [Tanacetum coccineum]
MRGQINLGRQTADREHNHALMAFTVNNEVEYKGDPIPLSGDYTRRETGGQIDALCRSIVNMVPQPQSPSPLCLMPVPLFTQPVHTNDSDGELVTIATQKTQPQVSKPKQTVTELESMNGKGIRAHLEDYQELSKEGSVTFGGSKGSISGKDLRYVDKKLNVLFTEKECFVVSSDFKMPDENQVLLKVPRQHNMYTFDMKKVDSSKGYTCLLAKASSNEAKLWHKRLGHLNFKNLNKLVKGNLVRGLPSKSFKNDHTCVACQKGKQHKASCKAKIDRYVTHPLHTLHMDLFGPTSVRSINHASYCLVITDDCSRFFFLAKKDETSGILKTFIRQIENQLNQQVKIIRSDNGIEFKNRVMLEFYGEKGIKQEFSNARTPQQNGVAERMNRTLIEAARTMLADSHLPTTFWAEAVNTACYTFNRVRVTKPQNKTPYELLFGHKPILSYIRPFGCHVTILNTLSQLGKFDEKSDEGFLVGYSVNSKAFRVYNLVTKRVEVNLHVNFLEEKPNVQGIGHRWMFDLDYLTDSMNYIPVSLQNQANPAGSKEVIDIDVQTEEAADLMVVSSTSLTEATRKAAVSEKIATKKTHSPRQPSSTPISKSADDIMTFRKELDALALKHLGPVPATAPTSTNPVNTGSDNLNTGFEEVTPGNIEAISPSADHEEEVFSDADDDEMPEIRIYDKSSEGIFEKASYDDDGIITDFNNLPDEVDVSTNHTLRIHNAHPQSQILGDPNTPVQTRSSLKKITEAHALVSYIQAQQRSNHKDQQHCLFACFLSQSEPRKVSEALEDESWVEAMQEELLQFKLQQVWVLVDLPNGAKVIGTKWVYRNKKDERGVVVRNKARLVAQGHRQEEGITSIWSSSRFIDKKMGLTMMSFRAPVARIEAIGCVLAYASFMVYKSNHEQGPKGGHLHILQRQDAEAFDVDVTFVQIYEGNSKDFSSNAVKRIFKYLKGKPKLDYGILGTTPSLGSFLDSDYGGSNLEGNPQPVKQFWQSAIAHTRADGSLEIIATIDTIRYTISEASIRDSLQLDDATGITMLPNVDIFEENKHPYLAVSLTKKIFGNMKRGFQGAPRPLLPSMLLVASNPNQKDRQCMLKVISTIHQHTTFPKSTSPPSSYSIPTHHQYQYLLPPSITNTTPPPTSPPPPPPETEPTTDEYIYEEHSPVHHHFSPSQEQAPSRMPMDDLLHTIPNFYKRRNLVLTESEDEEPEAQGRKSQADPQILQYRDGPLTIGKGVTKRRKETKGKKVVSSLDFQEDVAEKINTAGEINAASIEVNTASKVNTGSIELNTVIEQEEASLAEAIRLDSLQKEEEAKQIHLDALLAQRIAEEEELTEQQKKRKAQVQFEAQYYTNEDWDLIRAKLEANAELSKSMLGSELQGERRTLPKRMVDLVNQRKKLFAEERAKAKRNKPMTQSQLKTYMMNYLKNQGSWKINQLKKLSFAEVKEEFDKLVKQIESFAPISFEATKASLKRFGEELQTKTPKRLKEDKDDESKEDESTKKSGKRRKQMARKGMNTNVDENDSEDSDKVDEQEETNTGTETPINPVPVAMKTPSVATYKIIKQGEKGVYQIVREDGTDIVYINFGAMLKSISRDDLTELYRIVMNRYGVDGPEDKLEKGFWNVLRIIV